MSQGTRDKAKEQRYKTRKVLRTMEMTLNLTFEDGLKVVEAMKDAAIENGWDAEELDECGVIEEYSRVIDAALTAMGINIKIDGNPSCEDEDFDDEDEDEDEGDDSCQYSLTPKGRFVLDYMEAGNSFEEACEVADILFNEQDEGDEEEEEEEEGEEENPLSDTLIMAGMLAGALDSREWDTNDPEEMKLLVETVLSATVQFKKEVLGE